MALSFEQDIDQAVSNYLNDENELSKAIEKYYYFAQKNSELIKWPEQSVFVGAEGVYTLFHEDIEKNPHDESLFSTIVENYTICSILTAWSKLKTIVSLPKEKIKKSSLKVPCSFISKLPSWVVCIDLRDSGLVFPYAEEFKLFMDEDDDDTGVRNLKIKAVFFARQIFTCLQGETDTDEVCDPYATLPNEPKVAFNNICSCFLLENGEFVLADCQPINSRETLDKLMKTSFKRAKALIQAQIKTAQKLAPQLAKEMQETTEQTLNNNYNLRVESLSRLVYFIEHLDELKDVNGKPATMRGNPVLTLFGNNVPTLPEAKQVITYTM